MGWLLQKNPPQACAGGLERLRLSKAVNMRSSDR
jgi:hypothetical protein